MAVNGSMNDQTVIPASVSPIGVFFVVVPGAVIAASAIMFLRWRLTVVLMLLLLLTVVVCLALLKTAIDDMSSVTLEWSPQGVSFRRILGGGTYAWTQIDKVALYDPGATFGDFGRHEESRAGIALYIRDPNRKDQPIGEIPPDVIVLSRCGDAAGPIPLLVDRLASAKRAGSKDGRRIGGVAKGATPVRKGFRKTANAA